MCNDIVIGNVSIEHDRRISWLHNAQVVIEHDNNRIE